MRHELEDPKTDVNLTVSAGDEVAITLAELGAAGYVWEVLAPSPLVTCTKEPVETKPKPGIIGGPNPVRFVLVPSKAGTSLTTLVHRRPWAKDDEAARLIVTLTRA